MRQPDIRGVAIVGSWAGGEPRMDSDIDIVVLADDPSPYVSADDWIAAALGDDAPVIRTRNWGEALTERRVRLRSGFEVEFGFASVAWAKTDPVDPGTAAVVQHGCRPVFDPNLMIERLVASVATDDRLRRLRSQRVGDTVRRPPGPNPAFVRDLLRFLERQSFDAAPRFLGVDEQGRDIVTFAEGFVAPDLDWRRWRLEQMAAAFALLRTFHDLTVGSHLAGPAEVVCHNDFTPQNVVFRDGQPAVIIDWEFAAPGTRRRDLAHALWQWLNIGADGPPVERLGAMVRRMLAAYGPVNIGDLVADIRLREVEWLELATVAAGSGSPTLNRSPQHWAAAATWVQRELTWLDEHADELRAAI